MESTHTLKRNTESKAQKITYGDFSVLRYCQGHEGTNLYTYKEKNTDQRFVEDF